MSNSEFKVFDADRPQDREQWIELWQSWPEREVFAHPDYLRLYRDNTNRAMAACLARPEGCVLYPFLLRDLQAEDFWGKEACPAFDIVTPYGYGGPFAWGEREREPAAESFWKHWEEWAVSKGVVCEFLRLSLFPETMLFYPGEVEKKSSNVVRELESPLETIWMDFAHKVRKNVKRAQKEGVNVEVDLEGRYLDDFLRIYKDTLDRREAKDTYYFSPQYFESIVQNLSGQYALFHAYCRGKCVSTEMVLVSRNNIYSFLGGTHASFYPARPNDMLKHRIISWGQEQGKKHFVLGGGYEPEDGIYKYKLAFAPHGAVSFYVGKRIFLPETYLELIEARKTFERQRGNHWTPTPGFFPEYR